MMIGSNIVSVFIEYFDLLSSMFGERRHRIFFINLLKDPQSKLKILGGKKFRSLSFMISEHFTTLIKMDMKNKQITDSNYLYVILIGQDIYSYPR